ncbi:MAG: PIN domain-containing protein [Burkholderiales bacterium]|nr:MAG: PIN domain-containing protein [Burkholderiales bacterium]
MGALDTSVLVRYLCRDDPRQAAAAQRLVEEALARGDTLYVPVTVTLELEWVMRARFGIDKPGFLQLLSTLLSTTELVFESEPAVEGALRLYETTRADFADCLHAALAFVAGRTPLRTFDRVASRIAGARAVPG